MRRCTKLLLPMLACLSLLLLLAPSANAGLFHRNGGGLFGRRANASACASGYSTQSYGYAVQAAAPCAPCGGQASYGAPCAPCGQATATTYQSYGYSYQAAPAAPCAPCGQVAAPLPAYAPVQYQSHAPAIQSAPAPPPPQAPGVSYRYNMIPQIACPDGKCNLRR